MIQEEEKARLAFIIMPFDQEFQNIYEDLIIPALEAAGYEVQRADSSLDQQNIMKTIITKLDQADLVVVELTSLNSNVMYELGVAHGLGKPTIMLTQSIDEIPFDLRSYKIIVYSTRYDEVKKLQDQLKEVALSLTAEKVSFGNPVSDFAPSRQKTGEIPEEEAVTLEPEEEYGILDFSQGAEAAIEKITDFLGTIAEKSKELTNKMKARAEEVKALSGKDTPGTASRTHKISKALGSDMVQYAEDIESELPTMSNVWERFVENSTNLFARIRIENAEDRESFLQVRSTMEEAKASFTFALDSTYSAKEGISQLKGISRDLNLGVRRDSQALDAIIDFFSVGESYIVRMINLIDERLAVAKEE